MCDLHLLNILFFVCDHGGVWLKEQEQEIVQMVLTDSGTAESNHADQS